MRCLTNVMMMDDFLIVATDKLREEFCFKTAIVSGRWALKYIHEELDSIINFCEEKCTSQVLINHTCGDECDKAGRVNYKTTIYFKEKSDLVMFKLGFSETETVI